MSSWRIIETGLASVRSPIGDGTRAFYQTHIPLHFQGNFLQADNGASAPTVNLLGRRTFTLDVQLAPAAAAFTVTLAGSFDNNTWYTIGTAVAAAGTTTFTSTHYYPYYCITTAGLASGEGLQVNLVSVGV